MPEKINTRKSVYQDSYPERAYNMCLLGLENKHLMAAFGVSSRTLDNWMDWHPEFRQAIQEGREEADSRVARALYERAIGYKHPDTEIKVIRGQITPIEIIKQYPPDVTACMYWLQNRTSRTDKPWRNNAALELTGKDGGAIEVDNRLKLSTLDLSDMTDAELEILGRLAPKLVEQFPPEK